MACSQRLLALLLLPLVFIPQVTAVIVKSSHVLKGWKPPKAKMKGWRFGGGRIVERETDPLGYSEASCSKSFPAPMKGSKVCPAECPLMQYDNDMVCHYRCITAEQCVSAPDMPTSHVDFDRGTCSVCGVPACKKCAPNGQECLECVDGFELGWRTRWSDGQCKSKFRWFPLGIMAFFLAIAVAALAWLIQLACRPVKNQTALDAALCHRSHSKIRHEEGRHMLYPLTTDVCSEFIPQGGVGVMLHFRFERAALLWTLFVLLVMGYVAFSHGRLQVTEVLKMSPQHDDVYEKCLALDKEDQKDLRDLRIDFLYATAFIYIVSFVGAILFAISQRRAYFETDASTATMVDFALFCEGFPRETWGPVEPQEGKVELEDEYMHFFRDSSWGDSVLGVSIVWDLTDVHDDVFKVLDDAISRMEADCRLDEPIEEPFTTSTTPLWVRSIEGNLLGVGEPQTPKDKGEGGGDEGGVADTSESWRGPAAIQRFTDMQTAGGIFVVFRTKGDMLRALTTPLHKFRGTHDIDVQNLNCQPASLLWDGFGVTHAQRVREIVKGMSALMVLILVWTVFFWGPYSYFILLWMEAPGAAKALNQEARGMVYSTVLGLIIAIGNLVLYAACAVIAQRCRFKTTDSRGRAHVIFYTFTVFVNVTLDLVLLTYIAHHMTKNIGFDENAFVRNPSMQHALFEQLVSYIYPGTILAPFLLEPLGVCVVPFYVYCWLIRSTADLSILQAEKLLECPPFDCNRYGDIIINCTLCCCIFFLTSVNIWWMFAQLLSSMLVICVWDRYRFLRQSTRMEFAAKRMDVAAQYLTVLPCAILFGGLTFKFMGGQAMVKKWGRHAYFSRSEWFCVLVAMLVHVILHSLLLHFVVPLFDREIEEEERDYLEVAESTSSNWFNANPVHCMRSLHYYRHDPPHVFDYPGRAHLHKQNLDIHAYYEAPEFEEEEGFRSVKTYVRRARGKIPGLSPR